MLETNQRALSHLIKFLDKCYQPLKSTSSWTISPYKEIPTGLLFPGVNIPDHELLFRQIAAKIRDETGHLLAVLQSKDCPSLRVMLKSMISQFVGTIYEGDEHITGIREEHASSYKGKGCAAAPCDMQILEGWYLRQHSSPSTSGKETATPRRNLIVVIQDFESFSPDVLEDFLTICSIYTDRLPIILLLGIATSFEALHQALPQSAHSLLRTEKFSLSTAENGVDALIDEVLIRPTTGVKLSYSTFKHLLDNFHKHNRSLIGVVRCIKYAIMDFFYASPISLLACAEGSERDSIMKLLTVDHLECLRMQTSFKSYIERLAERDPEDARLLLTCDEHLIARLPSFLDDLTLYHRRFAAAMDVLDTLQGEVTRAVNATSLHRARRNLYELALEQPIAESAYFANLMKVFSKLDLASLKTMTKDCRDVLNRSFDISAAEYCQISSMLEKVLQATEEKFDADSVTEVCPVEASHTHLTSAAGGEGQQSSDADVPEKPKTRLALRQSVANKEKAEEVVAVRRRTALEKLREQAKAAWEEFFRWLMPHYTSVVLSEISYHHNSRLLSRAFCAQPRAAIQIALEHPHHYLACPCCAGDDGHLHPHLPDTTIAYRLYLEFGRMINMYDWFVAFGMVVERGEKRKRQKPPEERRKRSRRSGNGKGKETEDGEQESSDGEKFKQEVQL